MEGAGVCAMFARAQLGEMVFVTLPQIGRNVKKDEEVAVIESVK